ncbi:MAG: NAD(P)H-hydrate epimerase [Candidatus Hodarchaeales archaeon]|jgi:NAD(P)H-hydrate epimerase
MSEIPLISDPIPCVTKDQMIEVDRLMMEEFGINLFQMMENAGRAIAIISKNLYLNTKKMSKIAVLVGTGGNGGGGLVAARRLLNWGYNVDVLLSKRGGEFKSIPKHQLHAFKKMNGTIIEFDNFEKNTDYNLIIDSILGYSISGNPKNTVKDMIIWANSEKSNKETPILSLDLPSGMGSDGDAYDPIIKASGTITLALPKKSMFEKITRPYIGDLYLADISVPLSLYKKINIIFKTKEIFKTNEIIRIY